MNNGTKAAISDIAAAINLGEERLKQIHQQIADLEDEAEALSKLLGRESRPRRKPSRRFPYGYVKQATINAIKSIPHGEVFTRDDVHRRVEPHNGRKPTPQQVNAAMQFLHNRKSSMLRAVKVGTGSTLTKWMRTPGH